MYDRTDKHQLRKLLPMKVMKTRRLKSLSAWDRIKTNRTVIMLIIWSTNLEDKSRFSVNLT